MNEAIRTMVATTQIESRASKNTTSKAPKLNPITNAALAVATAISKVARSATVVSTAAPFSGQPPFDREPGRLKGG